MRLLLLGSRLSLDVIHTYICLLAGDVHDRQQAKDHAHSTLLDSLVVDKQTVLSEEGYEKRLHCLPLLLQALIRCCRMHHDM